MFQNPSPKEISIFCTVLTTAFFLIGLLIHKYLPFAQDNLIFIFGLSVVFAGLSFLIYFNFLKIFIYNRVRVIYKNIQKTKVKQKDLQKEYLMKDGIIDEVELDVQTWVTEQNKEISNLKNLEEYRRNYLGNVSHELKTPVFNIQGYIHSLLDGALHDPKINETYLRKAAQNTERLQVILEDLDAISRLESGELILEFQKFNIKDMVLSVFDDLSLIAKKNKVNLGFKKGSIDDFIVYADKENIRRVLSNLVLNGIKYGNEDGNVSVGFYDMDKTVLIEVSDDGIGMSQKHLNHVFDRFYRADKHRSRSQGGSGLGLSIVKHILEAHKQRITARSTPGVGSTFGFTLAKG